MNLMLCSFSFFQIFRADFFWELTLPSIPRILSKLLEGTLIGGAVFCLGFLISSSCSFECLFLFMVLMGWILWTSEDNFSHFQLAAH